MHKHLLVGVAVSTALALNLTGCSTGTHTSPPETVKSVSPLAPLRAFHCLAQCFLCAVRPVSGGVPPQGFEP